MPRVRSLTSVSLLALGLTLVLTWTRIGAFGAEPARAVLPPVPLAASVPAGASALAGSLRVNAEGAAQARPSHVDVLGRLKSSSEVASEALAGLRDLHRRVAEELGAAGIPGLELQGRGASLTYTKPASADQLNGGNGMVWINGRMTEPEQPAAGIEYIEELRMRLSGLDQVAVEVAEERLAALLDAALDAGVILGPAVDPMNRSFNATNAPALLLYGIENPEELEEQAFADALESARTRGESLARLSGKELGGVRDIQVTKVERRWVRAGGGYDCRVTMSVTFELP